MVSRRGGGGAVDRVAGNDLLDQGRRGGGPRQGEEDSRRQGRGAQRRQHPAPERPPAARLDAVPDAGLPAGRRLVVLSNDRDLFAQALEGGARFHAVRTGREVLVQRLTLLE